jgi:hypothetical protein
MMAAAEESAARDVETMDLVCAQGLALALVGALLEGDGVVAKGEFSRLLGTLAVVTAETNGAQGDILAAWSAMASNPT